MIHMVDGVGRITKERGKTTGRNNRHLFLTFRLNAGDQPLDKRHITPENTRLHGRYRIAADH